MSTIIIEMQATPAQIQSFEHRCEVTELILAGTLCSRFGITPSPEHLALISGWMSSSRALGIANHLASGIQMQMHTDPPQPAQPSGESGWLNQHAEAAADALQLCYLIEAAGASPELTAISLKASDLRQKLQAMCNAS